MNFDQTKLVKSLSGRDRMSFLELAKALSIKREQNQAFSIFLNDLVAKNIVFVTKHKDYFIPKFLPKKINGVAHVNPKGFGFVDYLLPTGEKASAFIAPTSLGTTMNGDEIEVELFKDPDMPASQQAIVRKVLKRHRTFFVGTLIKQDGKFYVHPLDTKVIGRFRLIGDVVKVEPDWLIKVRILTFDRNECTVSLETVIGSKDQTAADILAEIEDAGVPYKFNQKTLDEARTLPKEVLAPELKGRKDYRNEWIVTIDGDDTKDFDDAVIVKKLDNGHYMLGVHIADVTHYVQEGKPLDQEANLRGTSVYLADRVLPMLPEALSNGVCSLNPSVDRLVLSLEVEIDKQGKNVRYEIHPGVIRSRQRLTYQQVNAFYLNPSDGQIATKEIKAMLMDALELSKIIRKQKEADGYIDFEIEESKIKVDENGKVIDIVPRTRGRSEMLIEDFMVRANEVVAEHVAKAKLAFIYRVHAKPDIKRVESLEGIVKVLGIDVTIPRQPVPREFAKAISQIKATRFDDFMKTIFLRTMAKAEYSPMNIGHFGLASQFYTHFTSPIRRYPDLMVHRMLRTYFFENNVKATDHFSSILGDIAMHSSATEVSAVELERRVADIKKAEFYQGFIGQSFEGTIVTVLGFGFFVEFPNKVGGLVHLSSLIDGEYALAQSGFSLESKKRKFTLGDKIKVTVAAAVKDEGRIELVPTDLYEAWKKQPRPTTPYRR